MALRQFQNKYEERNTMTKQYSDMLLLINRNGMGDADLDLQGKLIKTYF